MNDFLLNLATSMPGFLLAIVCHEAAHGYVAYKFGDPTAKLAGRVTINPAAHFDLFGTIIFPLIGAATGGVMFGWAKPVPVNVRYFKNIRSGIFWVSFAGPGMNLILGVLSAFLFALLANKVDQSFYLHAPFLQILGKSVVINFVLAVFNLIPLPPLDGSKMVSSFLSYENSRKYEQLGAYSFFIFLGLIFLDSYMNISILGKLLEPARVFSQFSMHFFFNLFS